uniref:Uncharacterized protein n=1 Tax=Ditylenchus dipsaci TaxID=166011 RepID=A0A915E9M4_9BILA
MRLQNENDAHYHCETILILQNSHSHSVILTQLFKNTALIRPDSCSQRIDRTPVIGGSNYGMLVIVPAIQHIDSTPVNGGSNYGMLVVVPAIQHIDSTPVNDGSNYGMLTSSRRSQRLMKWQKFGKQKWRDADLTPAVLKIEEVAEMR